MNHPALTVKYDTLYLDDHMLLCIYPAGDCDRCDWPMVDGTYTVAKQRGILAHALFDAREMGDLPAHCDWVVLPDGAEFSINGELYTWELAEEQRLQWEEAIAEVDAAEKEFASL